MNVFEFVSWDCQDCYIWGHDSQTVCRGVPVEWLSLSFIGFSLSNR